MFYICGDTHLHLGRIPKYVFSKENTLIILGDHMFLSYVKWDKENDCYKMTELNEGILKLIQATPCNFFVIMGGRDAPPALIDGMLECKAFGGDAYSHPLANNLIFAKTGEVYKFGNKRCLVLDGAASPTQAIDLNAHENKKNENKNVFFPENQPCVELEWKDEWENVDCVLSHTCPLEIRPNEVYLNGEINSFDTKTEQQLSEFLPKLKSVKDWYCGYFHTNLSKEYDGIRFHFLYSIVDKI